MKRSHERESVVVVTGGTRGIGVEVARRLARHGHSLVLLCRDQERGRAALGSLAGRGHHAVTGDLARWDTVRNAAEQVHALGRPVQALINNAALIVPDRRLNENGVELQLAVNHLGHFLWTQLLLPLLGQRGPSRVVTLSSGSHYGPAVDLDDPNFERRPYRRLVAYQQSKLANVAFTLALARRVAGRAIEAVALQPGVYDTRLWADYTGLGRLSGAVVPSPRHAAPYVTRLAVVDDPRVPRDNSVNGLYFKKMKVALPAEAASDIQHQDRLWAWSESKLGRTGGS